MALGTFTTATTDVERYQFTDISVDGNQVTYTSDYDETIYVYTATINVEDDGSLTLEEATGGVTSVTGTGSITQTSYTDGGCVADVGRGTLPAARLVGWTR